MFYGAVMTEKGALSEERSGVMTKSANVFDQMPRQIKCIKSSTQGIN
jgi:hypothetical protein